MTADGDTSASPDPIDETGAYHAVEFVGKTTRRADWQTRLVPLEAWYDNGSADIDSRPPLSTVVETLAASSIPAVYQALVQPMPSWAGAAEERRYNLLEGRDTFVDRWFDNLDLGSGEYGTRNRETLERRRGEMTDDPFSSGGGTATGSESNPVDRVRAIEARDADRSFVVNARVVACDRLHESTAPPTTQTSPPPTVDTDAVGAASLCTELTSAFSSMRGPYHTIEGRHRRGSDAIAVRDALCGRTLQTPEYDRVTTRLPGVQPTSRGIVAGPREASVFCLLDGGSLTPTAMEALAPTPGERARPEGPPPSRELLSRYRGPGLTLGTLQPGWTTGVDEHGVGYHDSTSRVVGRTDSGTTDSGIRTDSFVVRLPPALQRLHVAWFGKTGSGKTTAATIGLLDNHAATQGATVLIDQKGDGMADDLMQMKYTREEQAELDDIIYFDAAQFLPAFSFFDIRDQLLAGVPHSVAVADVIDHYVEIICQLKSREWYDSAPLSAKLIEAVLTAMFDPVHGQDAFSHREFRATLSWMRREQTAPAVSDIETQTVLEDAVTAGEREFTNIMNGVLNRVDEITNHTYLSTVLNNVGPAPGSGAVADSPESSDPDVDAHADSHAYSIADQTDLDGRDSAGETDRLDASHRSDVGRESTRRSKHGSESDAPSEFEAEAESEPEFEFEAESVSTPTSETPGSGSENQHPRETIPSFEFGDVLDTNTIVIFDTGGLREEAQRALTVLIVSKLWTALRRRTHRQQQRYGHERSHDQTPEQRHGQGHGSTPDSGRALGVSDDLDYRTDRTTDGDRDREENADAGDTTLPLVNLFVEEASKVAGSGVVTDLLKQARSFGCSVTLSMQYPAQLKHADEETYNEVLNNVSTIVTGNVPLDRDLAARLATSDMPPQEVANRLRALSRGEWFCTLPAGFGQTEPRPFVLDSAPLPSGHPEGPDPLRGYAELQCEIEQVRCTDRTRRRHGITVAQPSTVDAERDGVEDAVGAPAVETAAMSGEDDAGADDDPDRLPRVDTALPYTRRLPKTVTYVDERHALDCTECGNRYDPSSDGMKRAISCCSSLEAVDPDDIPITDVNLKLSHAERAETDLSDRELLLLQVIHNAQQLRYEPPEYDLLHDSMIRLLEHVGASNEDVQRLIEAGYLTHDANHPHRLYSVTPTGRNVIGEAYREGVDFGHGTGDLEESSLHVMMVEVGYRYLVQSYRDDPESPVTEVIKYFDLDRAPIETTGGGVGGGEADRDVATNANGDEKTDTEAEVEETTEAAADTDANAESSDTTPHTESRRIDAAGLDAEGNVVVTLEAERVNHDVRRAVPADYDKMAACDPEDAIWVCWKQKEGYKILRALNEPLDGITRVEKEYSSTTPPHQYRIDTPGLTAMYNVEYLRDRLEGDHV
ncbi:hypothetical protein [Salinigranum marinum]|uniref:hypothetical protein n=1 Tax=Salinigranum marinum TaxID=1515595 RepID=UPI002989AB91|nr:hypothetical protein [Salinigranum marinum]